LSQLWVPGAGGPSQADFVGRILRQIRGFAEERGVERPVVEVMLHDGTRFAVAAVSPEPGFGMVTLIPERDGDDDLPEAMIVPLGSIVRIGLHVAAERRGRLGFSVPSDV
jgi:hypothetical protein